MAIELASAGHSVDLYGRPEQARSRAALGPQYLWATKASTRFLVEKLGWTEREVADRITEMRVRWASKGLDAGPNAAASHSRIAGYASKFGGDSNSHPCRGVSEFYAIEDGLPTVNARLTARLDQAGVNLIREDVVWVFVRKDGVFVDTTMTGSRKYGGVVNTLSRDAWMKLIGKPGPSLTRTTYFHLSSSEPVVDAQPRSLYYNGDWNTPWYRASYSHRNEAWVYESTEAKIDRPVFESHPLVSKFTNAQAPGISEVQRVTHVGRWAEMRPEMMVDDVMENAQHYRFVIERDA